MSNIVCKNCKSPYITPGRNQVVDDEGNITEEEVECTDCHNVWNIKYRGMADRDILLSQKTRPLLFCATHQLESFIKKGYRASEAQAELEARRTPLAPDAGDSAASSGIVHASAGCGRIVVILKIAARVMPAVGRLFHDPRKAKWNQQRRQVMVVYGAGMLLSRLLSCFDGWQLKQKICQPCLLCACFSFG